MIISQIRQEMQKDIDKSCKYVTIYAWYIDTISI